MVLLSMDTQSLAQIVTCPVNSIKISDTLLLFLTIKKVYKLSTTSDLRKTCALSGYRYALQLNIIKTYVDI